MARVSKMKIIHKGEFIENEAKEYPNIKAISTAELPKIIVKNGKVVVESPEK